MISNLLVALALFGLGLWAAKRWPWPLALTLGLMAAIPTVMLYAAYALPPSHAWGPFVWSWRAWPLSETLAGGIGFLAGFVQVQAPRVPELKRLLGNLVVPVLFAALVMGPYLKPLLQPPPWDEFDRIWVNDVCKQSTAYSCGPCSVATLLRFNGLPAEEKALAHEVHLSRRGSEPWHLARALQARGLRVTFKVVDARQEPLPVPAIAQVDLNGIDHVIPLLARQGNAYVVGDPVYGREVLTLDQLLQRYRFRGLFLQLG